jgi:hypothetical protein
MKNRTLAWKSAHGVVRVDHQRHAQGFEAATGQLGPMALADGGRPLPNTWEKLTPPFSITAPFSITRVRPPPPAGGSRRLRRSACRLFGFQGAANAVLQVEQVGLYGLGAGSHGITLNRAKLREAIGRRRQMGA